MIETIDLTNVDDALAVAEPRIDRTGQLVAVATYRSLALSEPASVASIATTSGIDESTVERLLDDSTFSLSLEDGVELARRHTDRCFGEALR